MASYPATLRLPLLALALVLLSHPLAAAQSVREANDNVGTRVRQRDRRFDIDGGTRSDNGENLFHSFEQFGLSSDQVANFLSDPEVRNILGRVTGGEASFIDGLLRVSGSDANLFLINPAGVLFGENARLDLLGDFTATTATGIGFAEETFPAVGEADYSALVGDPTTFAFSTDDPGAVVNQGDLALSAGASLTLLGGQVINTGSITAPEGTITVAAVAGNSRVRINQAGMLLGLELEAQATSDEGALPFTPLALPALLTGGEAISASAVEVTETGEIRISGSGVTVPDRPGTAIASGTLDVSDPTSTTAEINVIGDRVVVTNALLDASGADGGVVRVGGDVRGEGSIPNATDTLFTTDSAIHADALASGDGGTVAIWSNGNATIAGELTARGGATAGDGGFIETSGRETLTLTSTPDASAPNGVGGTWLIDPTDVTIVAGDAGPIGTNEVGAGAINAALNAGTSVTITTDLGLDGEDAGNITQNANAPIEKTAGGDAALALEANNDIILNGGITATSGALDITLTADTDDGGQGSITVTGNGIASNGGDITIFGSASTEFIAETALSDPGVIIDAAVSSDGGDITITADDATLPDIDGLTAVDALVSLTAPVDAGTGALTLQTDILPNLAFLSGSGTLQLQPEADGQAIDLSGTAAPGAPGFSLNLASIPTSFSDIVVGDRDNDNPITVRGDLTFNAPLTLQTAETITFDNAAETPSILLTGPSLTAISDEIDVRSNLVATGDLSLNAVDGTIALFAPSITANDISLSGQTASGSALTADARNDITLDTDLDAATITLTAGNDITFNNEFVGVEQLTAIANNNIVIAEEVSLTFGAPTALEGAIPASGAITLSANNVLGGGVMMDTAESLTVTGGQDLTVSGDTITLGAIAAGDFVDENGALVGAAADVTLEATGDISVDSIESSANDGSPNAGNVSLSSTTGTIDVAGDITVEAVGAAATLQGGNVTIDAAQGDVTIDGTVQTSARSTMPASDNAPQSLTAGDIAINAPNGDVVIEGQLAAFADSGAPNTADAPAGGGGGVSITADQIQIDNAAAAAVRPEAVNASGTAALTGFPGIGGAIALTAPNGMQINGDIVTSNASITLTGPVDLDGAGSDAIGGGGSQAIVGNQSTTGAIAFNGSLEAPNGLIIAAGTGDVTFGGAVGAVTPLAELSIDSGGVTQFNGDVTAERLVTDAVGSTDLGSNRTVTVDELALEDPVTGSGALTIRPLSPSQDIALGIDASDASENTLTLTDDFISQLTSFSSLTVGLSEGTGDVSLDLDAQFAIPTTIAGGDTLIGPDQGTTYSFIGSNSGRVFGLSAGTVPVVFNNIDAVQAGSGNDIFRRIDQFTNAIDGGEGADTAIFQANSVITLDQLATLAGIEAVDGNNGTLFGTDAADTFTITDARVVEVQALSISNLDAIDGGGGGDRFRVLSDVNINGFIRGGAGRDTIDYSDFNGALTLDLVALAPDGIERLVGTSGNDEIQLGGSFDGSLFDGTIDGGPGTLLLSGGTIDLTDLNILTQGPLEIDGTGAVTVADLENPGNGITLRGNSITAGDIDTSFSSFGGDIVLEANTTIEAGDLTASGLNGGNVTVQAGVEITVGRIDTSGEVGDGGNVLLDPSGDIEVTAINAQGGDEGTGGAVDITTGRFFRATGDFTDQNNTVASISTAGGNGGGSITIRHGGNGVLPFTVGTTSGGNLANGTAAAITSGTTTIGNQVVEGDLDVGNVAILTGAIDAPGLPENPCPPDCQVITSSEIDPNVTVSDLGGTPITETLSSNVADVSAVVGALEQKATAEFSDYLGLRNAPSPVSLAAIVADLKQVQAEAGISPAILYVVFGEEAKGGLVSPATAENRRLELILLTADDAPLHIGIPEATQRQVQTMAARLRRQVSIPSRVGTDTYDASAQQLHRWLIDPVEDELAQRGIDTLGIVTDAGLRSLPFAALHDGDSFLVERYALTLIPSASLTVLDYKNLQQSNVLVGGASSFANQAPLPFVPIELNRIQAVWGGDRFQGDEFTRKALSDRVQQDYGIVHLATHGEFQPGSIENSYIQFSDGRLRVDELQQLEWQPDNIRLVTLSACQTALGNREAELGFAGLAVAAGAQSALASLWSVSDAATTSLMVEFYQNLQTTTTKANALRAAQLALLQNDVTLTEDIRSESSLLALPLDDTTAEDDVSFSHPFYWSAFTLVGSPW